MSDDPKENNQIVINPIKSTPLDFPEPSEFIDKKYALKTRQVIQENGVYDDKGKTALNTRALPHLLCTDIVGAKKFYNRLPDEDKFKYGKDRFVKTPAVKRALDERIEKPYDAKKTEQMRENERCLTALRDNSRSRTQRALNENKIRNEQKYLKQRKIERDNITECQISGETLEPDAHAHHDERRADNPDLALDLDNIKVVNKGTHFAHHEKEKGEDYE